jgi:hypothetical protein
MQPLFLFVGNTVFFLFSGKKSEKNDGGLGEFLYLCKRFRFSVLGNFLKPENKKVIQNG